MTSFELKTKNFFDNFYRKKKVRGGKGPQNLEQDLLKNPHLRKYYSFEPRKFLSQKIIITSPKMKVLDVGCGQGGDLCSLIEKKKQGHFYGIDLSSIAVKKARQSLRKEVNQLKDKDQVKFSVSVQNAKKLSFKDDYFDCVYISMLLHHVDDFNQVISESHRVLKKGGQLLIADLKGTSYLSKIGQGFLKLLPQRFSESVLEGDLIVDGEFPQRQDVSSKKIRQLLLDKGFKVSYEAYYYLFFYLLFYFYKLYPSLYKLFLPINIILIRFEEKIKRFFKYSCDTYVFIGIKK